MLLKNAEAQLEALALLDQLTELHEQDGRPFPYEDCRWLAREFDVDLNMLIPDLNTWLFKLAGYCTCGKRLLSWPEERVQAAYGALQHGFFAEYPQYAWLPLHLSETQTPDLYARLALAEQKRLLLLELLRLLLHEKYSAPAAD